MMGCPFVVLYFAGVFWFNGFMGVCCLLILLVVGYVRTWWHLFWLKWNIRLCLSLLMWYFVL